MYPNQIMQLLHSRRLHNDAVQTFLHVFADINSSLVLDLINDLKSYPIETSDTEISVVLFNWYVALDEKEKIGFNLPEPEYQFQKAANIARSIKKSLVNPSDLRGESLLDIGAGDCTMTYLVSQLLKMESNAIDIQGEIDWGGLNSSDLQVANVYRDKIDNYYLYDGSDLLSALPEKKFKVVMYNHSLHHFPSFQAQIQSLRQATKLLEPGGMLFLSEHANAFDDEALDLAHLLFNLKYGIDKKQILTSNDSEMEVNKFKAEYQSYYFSKNMIDFLFKELGFTLVKETCRSKEDMAKTTFFCFVKNAPMKAQAYQAKFFEDKDVERLAHYKEKKPRRYTPTFYDDMDVNECSEELYHFALDKP